MYVIGTAGHVDHGKSTLVQALTGIDPDRLAEEKEREMTIDLGFAWLNLGEGEEVGVVDVPGHRDFIENMLAGVGSIDLALFVVAADEGVMPQTQEHLAILDLLEINQGVVALTKVDLIDDPDWLELVMLDLGETLASTVLANAPIVPVSARTGEGIQQLRDILWQGLQATTPRPDKGRPRLAIDRVFTLSGFGTVVTGTLIDGRFQLGDPVELQPSGLNGRIRGLQTHKTKREVALPGSRVAINVTGINRNEIKRGDVLAKPSTVSHTILLDASYRQLADIDTPLKHNMEVKLFVGAAEVVARTRILGSQVIEPGQTGWLQLALSQPAVAVRGDRFILRRPSPGATLGGGHVLDPHPGRRHRRFREDVITRLETLAQGTPEELLLQTLQRLEPIVIKKLRQQSGLDEVTTMAALASLQETGEVVQLGQQLISYEGRQTLVTQLQTMVAEHHHTYPLRLGIPREEIRSRLRLPATTFNALMHYVVAEKLVIEEGTLVREENHTIQFTTEQETAAANLLHRFAQMGVSSPSVKESKEAIGEDVYAALVDLGRLKPISNDVVYRQEEYEEIVARVVAYLQTHQQINAGQVRDLLQTSRKYGIALLEHLDHIRVTRRIGDNRELL